MLLLILGLNSSHLRLRLGGNLICRLWLSWLGKYLIPLLRHCHLGNHLIPWVWHQWLRNRQELLVLLRYNWNCLHPRLNRIR